MKSCIINLYLNSKFESTKTKMTAMTAEQIAFVDEVYALCEKHYNDGGDSVVETMEPWEVIVQFKSLTDARSFCGLKAEQALNARWGDDEDPQLKIMERFDNNWKE